LTLEPGNQSAARLRSLGFALPGDAPSPRPRCRVCPWCHRAIAPAQGHLILPDCDDLGPPLLVHAKRCADAVLALPRPRERYPRSVRSTWVLLDAIWDAKGLRKDRV
jgi:hypothetical protein